MNRLVLLSSDFLPIIGGVSLMSHHLANALVDQGVHVRVIAPQRDGDHSFPQNYEILYHDLPIVTASGALTHLLLEPGRLRKLADDQIADFRPDAVLLGHAYRYDQMAMQYCRETATPLATLVHGAELIQISSGRFQPPTLSPSALFNRMARRSIRRRTERLLSHSDVVFSNSHFTADLARRCGAGNIVVTGCGVRTEDLLREQSLRDSGDQSSRQARKTKLGFTDAPLIGCVARLVPSKNLSCLLDAVANVSELQAVIIGDGPERGRLQRQAEDLGVASRVRLTGRLAEQEKWEMLRAMDLFCLPSIELPGGEYEGFGIVLLEASIAGAMLIASHSGGMPDIVKQNETGILFSPGDSAHLARTINEALQDEAARSAMISAMQSRIENQFTWDAVANRMLDSFAKLPSR